MSTQLVLPKLDFVREVLQEGYLNLKIYSEKTDTSWGVFVVT